MKKIIQEKNIILIISKGDIPYNAFKILSEIFKSLRI